MNNKPTPQFPDWASNIGVAIFLVLFFGLVSILLVWTAKTLL